MEAGEDKAMPDNGADRDKPRFLLGHVRLRVSIAYNYLTGEGITVEIGHPALTQGDQANDFIADLYTIL
jgi:hypothetical protein